MKIPSKSLIFLPLLALLASCGGGSQGQVSSSIEASVSSIEERNNANGSVSYEIFVRSFYDHDGDGTGDFLGIKDKMSYLADMGIKTIWLLPIHKSPTYHGYDVDDYYSVCPEYGTIEDFDSMIEEANKYDIDVMIDMVLNHTSTSNPWFTQSYQDYVNNNTAANSKAAWYNWSDKSKNGYSEYGKTGKYYEARFNFSMPDLNMDNLQVREEIDKIFEFWIKDHGVKGFRLDAVKYYYYGNTANNVEFLNYLVDTAKAYDPNFYMVGEDWESDVLVTKYHASEVDSFFRFSTSSAPGGLGLFVNAAKGYRKASAYMNSLVKYEEGVKAANPNAYTSYFISNHDANRAAYSSEDQAKLAATLQIMTPGTPWIYYGEEILLWGSRLNEAEGSDVKRRLPLIWSKSDKTGECGFPEKSRPDLNNYTQVELGVYDQLANPNSLTNHYKKINRVRNEYPMFKHGVITSLLDGLNDTSDKVVAYQISLDGDYVNVYINLDTTAHDVVVQGEIKNEVDIFGTKSTLTGTTLSIQPYSLVITK
ncbi:MAG: hypothetical protein K5694_00075 [Bacilli bacterium]|nr:hypothetical protein [Bacilli bacterium]